MEGENILIIRSNINSEFNRFERMAKERAEKERLERAASWERERMEREAKEAEWKKSHPILGKYTYISMFNYDTYSWDGYYYNVYFYEWSDINSNPKRFPYSTALYKFLDSSKINLTDEQNDIIKTRTGIHMICIPGTHDLVLGNTHEELKEKFEAACNNRCTAIVPIST